MTKQIGVSDSVYDDLKRLKKGEKDSFSKVISILIEGANRKTKKEKISEEFYKFKHDILPMIDEEAWGVIEIIKFFLLTAIDEKDNKDKIRKIYEEISPILNQWEGLIDEMEIPEYTKQWIKGIIENTNKKSDLRAT